MESTTELYFGGIKGIKKQFFRDEKVIFSRKVKLVFFNYFIKTVIWQEKNWLF